MESQSSDGKDAVPFAMGDARQRENRELRQFSGEEISASGAMFGRVGGAVTAIPSAWAMKSSHSNNRHGQHACAPLAMTGDSDRHVHCTMVASGATNR